MRVVDPPRRATRMPRWPTSQALVRPAYGCPALTRRVVFLVRTSAPPLSFRGSNQRTSLRRGETTRSVNTINSSGNPRLARPCQHARRVYRARTDRVQAGPTSRRRKEQSDGAGDTQSDAKRRRRRPSKRGTSGAITIRASAKTDDLPNSSQFPCRTRGAGEQADDRHRGYRLTSSYPSQKHVHDPGKKSRYTKRNGLSFNFYFPKVSLQTM